MPFIPDEVKVHAEASGTKGEIEDEKEFIARDRIFDRRAFQLANSLGAVSDQNSEDFET
jgi:hypothetical protein